MSGGNTGHDTRTARTTQPTSPTSSNANHTSAGISNQDQQSGLLSRSDNVQEAVRDLGAVDGLTGSVSTTIGEIINGLVPRDRDQAQLTLGLQIPLNPAVHFTLQLQGQVQRKGNQIELGTSLQMGLRAERSVGRGWFRFSAFLEAHGIGYLRTLADTPQEAFEFIALGLQEIIRGYNQEIAELIMDPSTRSDIISNMSGEEMVELGLGVGVSAGASFGAGESEGSNAPDEPNVSVEGLAGTRFTNRDNDGNLESTSTKKLSLTFPMSNTTTRMGASPVVRGSLSFANGSLSEIEAYFGLEIEHIPNFNGAMVVSHMADIVSVIGGALLNAQEILGSSEQSVGERVGGIARNISDLTFADDALVGAVNYFGPDSVGIGITHALSVKYTWTPQGNKFELELRKTMDVSADTGGDLMRVSAEMSESMFHHEWNF